MSKFNVGDTVYYLSGTETYRFIRSGTILDLGYGDNFLKVAGSDWRVPKSNLYTTESDAKAARLAYYNREVEEAQRALDNARARLPNAVGWRERAEKKAQE